MRRNLLMCIIVVVLTFALTSCSSPIGLFHKSLSENIVGVWVGNFDVAEMVYRDLGEELGIELSPEPALCPVKLVFEEDGTGAIETNNDDFSQAVGQVIEPYVSGYLGFDASGLVRLYMAKIGQGMEGDGRTDFAYETNDEENTIIITEVEGGEDTDIGQYVDGNLEIDIDGQTVVFEKE